MPGRTPASGWGSRRRAGLIACAALAGLAIWAGCTVTADNYAIYSFFFDGVPDPDAPLGPGGRPARESPTYSKHQSWAEQKCADCHDAQRFEPEAVDSSTCLKCHENIPSSLPRMHGPVVTVACLWCHTHHESPYAALFKGPAREVCSSCHAPGMLGTDKTPEHLPDAQESCLECHFGHGGVSRHFLREVGNGMAPPAESVAPGVDVIDEPTIEGGNQLPIETEPQP